MKLVMEMEGERKKRKITDDEEEDEEVKMEKFFALIRSAKDIRDQLLDTGKAGQTANQKAPPPATAASAKPEEDQSKGKIETAVWQPCLEPKDFAGNDQVSKTDVNLIIKQVAIAGNSSRTSEEENQKADNNKNNNNKSNDKNHFQGNSRNRIVFDLNLFPVSVADLDTTDFRM